MVNEAQGAPKTSVLLGIVTHNRAELVPRAITSALAQKAVELRVAVIDDASTDATPQLRQQFSSVTWTRWSEPRGYVAARNHWMGLAGEDFFASLDDDAWFLNGDEIALAVKALTENSSIAAVAFDILSPDRPHRRERAKAQRVPSFIGCGHVLRLSAVRQVGIYEPTPGGYGGEEKDMCLRLLDARYEVVILPGVHVWHDKTPVARHLTRQYESGVSNDLMLTYRRTPLFLLPVAAIAKFFQHLTGATKRGQIRACWRGFASFFRALPTMWRTRRPVRFETLRAFMQLSRS